MICLGLQDKRLCVISYCTATSFFGLSVDLNRMAAALPSSKLRGVTSKTKKERFTRRATLALRGLLRVFGRFAKPQRGPELQS